MSIQDDELRDELAYQIALHGAKKDLLNMSLDEKLSLLIELLACKRYDPYNRASNYEYGYDINQELDILKVDIDKETLKELSILARKEYESE